MPNEERTARRAVARAGRRAVVLRCAIGGAALAILAGARPAVAAAQSGTDLLSPDTTVVTNEAPRLVSGRVVRPDSAKGVAGVPGIWVTLHRVGSDTAGPMDSSRTGPGGAYTFHYRRHGRADAIYFVSASYAGIAYFSLPLLSPRIVGDSAEITVYDTTAGPLTLHVRGRHMIVSAPNPDGTHDIVEVYELTNDSAVTLISRDDTHPTFSAILPAGASNFSVGQSDISPRAVRDDSGKVTVVAPFAPGLKQLSFSYRVPASDFPLAIPMTRDVSVLEVLAEDPRATVTGAKLARVAPVTIQGRPFTRFLAQDVPANAVFSVDEPRPGATSPDKRYLTVLAITLAVLMLGVLGFVLTRRRLVAAPGVEPAPALSAAPPGAAQRLAREIAALDADFEGQPAPSDQSRAAYTERRNALKQELARALDAERGGG